jgi:hypothetical protein
MIIDKEFNSIEDKIDWLVKNKQSLIAQKKAVMKTADAFSFSAAIYNSKSESFKANKPIENYKELDKIKVKIVINTTNVIDSHNDLHLPNMWNKSIKENKMIMHLSEHKMTFDDIISDGEDLKVKAENVSWKELGYDLIGNTQALIFESTIKRERNDKMFEKYAKGYVRNHSVGMQYVKLDLAVNSDMDEYAKEYDNWNKYLPMAINPEKAIDEGFFWVVQEAKVIEGSAVPLGSNTFTPTISNNIEPQKSTHKDHTEPSSDTLIQLKLNEILTKI